MMRKTTTDANTSKISPKMRLLIESPNLNESYIKIRKGVFCRKKYFPFLSVFQSSFSFPFKYSYVLIFKYLTFLTI